MLSGARLHPSVLRPPRSTELGKENFATIVPEVGDRVYVRPGSNEPPQQKRLQQPQQAQHAQRVQQQQHVAGLWCAASVVSVSEARSEAVVLYEQVCECVGVCVSV